MGLKPNEQNEEQAPGEGSNRAARLGFIVLVQVHYWQGQSACGGPIMRDLAAEKRGTKRRPCGRRDGTSRGRLREHQTSKMAGLSPCPSQASSSAGHTEGLQQASGHLLNPTGDGGHRSRGQAASLSRTRCHSPRRRRRNNSHPSARVRHSRARVALARGDTLLHRRRGLRLALLRPSLLKRPFPMGACALSAAKTDQPKHWPAKQRNHWRQSAPPLLVQVYARRSLHGAGPPLPSAALPH